MGKKLVKGNRKPYKRRIVAVDLDQTLCEEVCFTPEECREATPLLTNIRRVNKLAQAAFIIVYSARAHYLYMATVEWLDRHGVQYHAIRLGKIPADLYIDDKAVNFLLEPTDDDIRRIMTKDE